MTVFETVAELTAKVRAANEFLQGEWSDRKSGPFAWMDEDSSDRIFIQSYFGRRRLLQRHTIEKWLSHPAVYVLAGSPFPDDPDIALATWALDDGAVAAVLAADVDPDYARAANYAGVSDAWRIIDGWTNGIPVEFLAALHA